MELLGLLIFLLVLIAITFAIYKSVVSAHRNLGKQFQSPKLVLLSRIILVIFGCVVGVLFVSFSYYSSATQRINGIPLPWAAWEYSNGYWLPFASPITMIFVPFDFIFGFGITHFLTAVVIFAKNKLSIRKIESA